MAFTTSFAPQLIGQNGYTVVPLVTIGETIPGTTGALNASTAGGYQPVGILDGAGALRLDEDTVRAFTNHELLNGDGVEYTITQGTADPSDDFTLTGGRISFFDINTNTFEVEDAGLAYNTIIDGFGNVAIDNTFQPEAFSTNFGEGPGDGETLLGFSRFCSGGLVEADTFGEGRGIVDNIYFAGEEDGGGFNSVGGANWALDVATGTIYQVPALGRGSWENTTPVDTGTTEFVAFVLADDQSPFDFSGDGVDDVTPLYLYVGRKDDSDPNDFLARNGLKDGKLYVFVPGENQDADPNNDILDALDFRGAGTTASGTWVEVDNSQNLALASQDGSTGFDEYGFPTQGNLITQANSAAINALGVSRPEDVATNPNDGTQVVQALTGVDDFAVDPVTGDGADTFGQILLIDTDFTNLTDGATLDDVVIGAEVSILYDGDEDPNRRLRSPDNLDWADDGFIYVQEDEAEEDSLTGEILFGQGAVNTNEASILRLDPTASAAEAAVGANILTVGIVDRSQILDPSIPDPTTAVDEDFEFGDDDGIPTGNDIVITGLDGEPLVLNAGEWETSGIVDVSNLFDFEPGSIFLFDVQAHGLADQDAENLVQGELSALTDDNLSEGGQLALLLAPGVNLPAFFEGTDGVDVIVGTDGDDTVNAGAGNDFVVTGLGDDTLNGGAGDDVLGGGAGDDVLSGDGGNDLLRGAAGADELDGRSGSDFLRGGAGADTLTGNAGADTIVGGGGNDTASGGAGADTLRGSQGGDELSGGAGADAINGGQGSDEMNGDGGNDILRGGAGNDTLIGGAGSDIYIGGPGSDVFAIETGPGFDTVQDYRDGEDQIGLTGDLTFGALTINQVGSDTNILIDGDRSMLLLGVTASDLTSADFVAV
ncbi:MAG: alkaline phosphatase PhoX [Elainellaceae cyanobacterium]